ncbi:hypothetical protein BALCAV_0206625 [Alkalihalobacillus alcalophilus ATCC 27647 = CGMCC 1.3604]|uniref:Uncharacterized protein n=1 Tax=Alkalihalobacillus alcalophilus ATCC 27647 = CGMCC 1.3604 TaxID=1218173 RepID=A0A094WJW7_ALKAL|nr:hypothetical protein BALCAV_0206625 [Alkalihalobacillus alcalophilus ATCC 27647 = CGMCC 1.3604]
MLSVEMEALSFSVLHSLHALRVPRVNREPPHDKSLRGLPYFTSPAGVSGHSARSALVKEKRVEVIIDQLMNLLIV